MDGITEPVVLVLGHPIAGNPAQFAFERAFAALDLDWRVLSCDVPPEQLAEAISGADVLGFRGLMLDRSLVSSMESDAADCFFRGEHSESESSDADGWSSECSVAAWLTESIREHFREADRKAESLLWIGSPDDRFPSGVTDYETQSPIAWASAESIEKADVIGITEPVDVSRWPDGDGTLVIDFANTDSGLAKVKSRGYSVLGPSDLQLGMLSQAFQQWTGREPPRDILVEAIEEYTAV